MALHTRGRKEPDHCLSLFAALNLIACALIRYGIYRCSSTQAPGHKERTRARMMKIISYIQKRYANHPSLENWRAGKA